MAADIVNLRQARKSKARSEKERVAAENRERFGRPAAERRLDAATKNLEIKKLDGLQRKTTQAADPSLTTDTSDQSK